MIWGFIIETLPNRVRAEGQAPGGPIYEVIAAPITSTSIRPEIRGIALEDTQNELGIE